MRAGAVVHLRRQARHRVHLRSWLSRSDGSILRRPCKERCRNSLRVIAVRTVASHGMHTSTLILDPKSPTPRFWCCFSDLLRSQIILLVVPVQTGVAGALYLGATLYQVVSNGAGVPFLGGPTQEIWRTLGAAAAGVMVALASRGRGGGRYKFIQRF